MLCYYRAWNPHTRLTLHPAKSWSCPGKLVWDLPTILKEPHMINKVLQEGVPRCVSVCVTVPDLPVLNCSGTSFEFEFYHLLRWRQRIWVASPMDCCGSVVENASFLKYTLYSLCTWVRLPVIYHSFCSLLLCLQAVMTSCVPSYTERTVPIWDLGCCSLQSPFGLPPFTDAVPGKLPRGLFCRKDKL